MSATQTTTTTTRKWTDKKKNNNTKKVGKSVAKAYSAKLKKAKEPKKRVCPTCGRPL